MHNDPIIHCCEKHSVYRVKDGWVILSSQQVEDLPLPPSDFLPCGEQYFEDVHILGTTLARHRYRVKAGRSTVCENVRHAIAAGILK